MSKLVFTSSLAAAKALQQLIDNPGHPDGERITLAALDWLRRNAPKKHRQFEREMWLKLGKPQNALKNQ